MSTRLLHAYGGAPPVLERILCGDRRCGAEEFLVAVGAAHVSVLPRGPVAVVHQPVCLVVYGIPSNGTGRDRARWVCAVLEAASHASPTLLLPDVSWMPAKLYLAHDLDGNRPAPFKPSSALPVLFDSAVYSAVDSAVDSEVDSALEPCRCGSRREMLGRLLKVADWGEVVFPRLCADHVYSLPLRANCKGFFSDFIL